MASFFIQDKFYEVLMIDPDAPSAKDPKCRCWLHMLLSNVKVRRTIRPFICDEINPYCHNMHLT